MARGDNQGDPAAPPTPQSKRMVAALKQRLKERRVPYAQVAEHLGLSLSSVKRLFATGAFTLARLEAVCDLAGVDLLELARDADELRLRLDRLTVEQESALVGDPLLLLTAICALNRWRFAQIVERYRIAEHQLIRLLARLDRMGLIELLPGNRIRLRIARNFAWLPGGPIERYFVDHVQSELLAGAFKPERDLRRFAWGLLNAESAAALRAKVDDLMETFDELSRGDEVRAGEAGGATGRSLLVAFREWEPDSFRAMRRDG